MWTGTRLVYCDGARCRGSRSILNFTCKYSAKPLIRTLDPERLQSSDFVDASNLKKPEIIVRLKDDRRIEGKIFYSTSLRPLNFPPMTQGFLYYHCYPDLPPTTGEIRFRVTQSSDPSCFHNGTDLMRSDGVLPWSIPLIGLQSWHAPLKQLLCQDHNIPAAIKVRKTGFYLTYLEKPFIVTLEQTQFIRTMDSQLHIEDTLARILLPMPREYKRSAFKGKLLVRFEQASLSEHRDDTSIVLRVLKVVEPIEPLVKDAALFQPYPEAGTLLKSKSRGQIRTLVFGHQSLRLLPSIMGSPPPLSNLTSAKSSLVEPLARTIGTLNPHHLESSDFMDLTNLTNARVYRRDDSRKHSVLFYANQGSLNMPFPANTHGFLYLYQKPGLPLVSGEIRFRLTPSADPTQFEKGTDLFNPNGELWSVNMLQLTRRQHVSLKDQLYHDGYVELTQVISGLNPNVSSAQRMLCYMEQPFILDVSQRAHNLTFLLPNKSIRLKVRDIFGDESHNCTYTGRVVVRVERSTLPEHVNGNFVVFRVLKILDPVEPVDPNYNLRLPVPIVGEFIRTKRGFPRSFNLGRRPGLIDALANVPSVPDDEPDLESFR